MKRIFQTFYCNLKLSFIVYLLICGGLAGAARSQTGLALPQSLTGCFGIYKINSDNSIKGFEDFQYFELDEFANQASENLETASDGKTAINGKVKTTAQDFNLLKASVKQITIKGETYFEKIEFKTVEIKGISYKFIGKFLRDWNEDRRGGFTKIKGILTKYKKGKAIAQAELPFFEFGYE